MTHLQMKNLNKDNTRILIGNPGCGKTTALIQMLMEEVRSGTDLSEIGYCSFSVAAIEEAKMRALEALASAEISHQNSSSTSTPSSKKSAPVLSYFKTLHAMAFQLLGLSSDNLLTDYRMAEFGQMTALTFSPMNMTPGGDPTQKVFNQRITKGDKILHIISVARLYDQSIRDYAASIASELGDLSVAYIEHIASIYRDFKTLANLFDYTDMLVMAKTADLVTPKLKVLFIDEAQDLSTLQWIMVDRMAASAEKVIIAGDDKQAINTFAGADVNTFLHVPGRVEVLEQSYRIPKSVFKLANGLMKKMEKYRIEGTNWKPREEEGLVQKLPELPWNKMASGNWLVLARAKHQLEKIAEDMMRFTENGPMIFTINGYSPIDLDIFRTITLLREYNRVGRVQELVTLNDTDNTDLRKYKINVIRMFKKFIPCAHTSQPWEITQDFRDLIQQPWTAALSSRLSLSTLRYIDLLLPTYKEKGDDLFRNAPIRLMTMHAAKGREADNVVVLTDVPARVRETSLFEGDTEVKLFYVAVTRAKQNLYLITHNTRQVGLEYYL